MNKIIEVINRKNEVERKVSDLSLWLHQKASVEYYNWLQAGGNARTAKDKALDEIKMNSEESEGWLQKEEEVRTLKIDLSYISECLTIVKSLINVGTQEVLDEFILSIKEV